MINSQSYDEKTPAQKSWNKTTKPYPSWSPSYFPLPTSIFQNHPIPPCNHEENIRQIPQTQTCDQNTPVALLPELLPVLIKLLIATEMTTKKEFISELGTFSS